MARTKIGVDQKTLPDMFYIINQFNYHLFSQFFSKSVSPSVMNEFF